MVKSRPPLPPGKSANDFEGGSKGGEVKQVATRSGDNDVELEQSLRYLGLLEDVVSLLKEIETNNNSYNNPGVKCCWPTLWRMSIYSGNKLGERLKDEYERLLDSAQEEKEKEKKERGGGGLFPGIWSLVGPLIGLS